MTIVRTAFKNIECNNDLKSIYIPGRIIGVIACYKLKIKGEYNENKKEINGVPSELVEENYNVFGNIESKDSISYFHLDKYTFTRGCVLSFLVDSHPNIPANSKMMNKEECKLKIHRNRFKRDLQN